MLIHSTLPVINLNLPWEKHKRDNSPPPSQILLGPLLWDLLHVRKSQCECRPARALTYIHTQCARAHTRPSWARRAYLAPNATATRGGGWPNHLSFVLFMAPSYKMNSSSTNHQLSIFILCTPGHCLSGLHPLRRDHHWASPESSALNIILLLHGNLIHFREGIGSITHRSPLTPSDFYPFIT